MSKTYTKIEGKYDSEDDIKVLVREEKTIVTEEVHSLLSLRGEFKELKQKIEIAPEVLAQAEEKHSELEDFLAVVDTSTEAVQIKSK